MTDYRKDDEAEAPDAKGATEDQVEKISAIRGADVLGYQGGSREEHSGQNGPTETDPGFADNDPEDLAGDED